MTRTRAAARWLWRWRWAIALNAYLLSPLLFYELNIGQGGPDRSLLFVLPASVLGLVALQLAIRRLWISHVVLAPFYLLVAADLYLIATYRVRLSSSMMLVIAENFGDAHEYLDAHAPRVFGALTFLAVFYGLGLRGVKELQTGVPRLASLPPLGALGLLLVAVNRQVGGYLSLLTHDRSTPFGVVPQAFIAYSVHRDSIRQAERAKSFVFGARRQDPPSGRETYVLVIGESSRRDHWGLYGYQRDTTPKLATLENLVVFDDVLSQAALTQVAVPLIITRGSIVDMERMETEKSIVSVFHEIGFGTYWMSTQQRDPWTGVINRYATEADVERFYERRYDEVLVDALREILADDRLCDAKLFIVLHTMGSHFSYRSRYPRSFSAFPTERTVPSSQRLVNAYDNTLRYTDHVLFELIRLLRERGGTGALLYVSDHAENLRDDSRSLFGHSMNNEFDIPVPMFVWHSEELAAHHAAEVAALRENAKKPITTRAVFYSLVDIANVTLGDPAVKRFSAFSPTMETFPRMALAWGESEAVDFDRWSEHQGRGRAGGASRVEEVRPATESKAPPILVDFVTTPH